MGELRYRRDIDGLRSLAVLPVVLNHAGLEFAPGGFIGVDIFFVISGFLITGILTREIAEGNFSILRFYERRIRRIMPALVVMLAACLFLGWFILLPDEYTRLAKSTVAALFFSSNIWFWRMAGDYFADSVLTELLLHTWSLAVEEQFYLFFPLLLALMGSRLRHGWGWVIGLGTLGSFALSVAVTESHPTFNFYLPFTRAWELGIGALIAIGTIPAIRSRAVNDAISLAGVAAIVLGIALIDETTPFPGLAALPACLGAAAIIHSGQQGETAGGKLLSVPVLVWFGLISYSLYLWHWPVMAAARIVTGENTLAPALALSCIALSILLGWASWRFVERPFRNTRTGFWQPPRRIFASAGAAMGAVALSCTAVLAMSGIPARIPGPVYTEYKEAKMRSPIERRCVDRGIGQPPCRLGAADAPVAYVIWGDSHAAAMLPGFDNYLRAAGQSAVAFTKTACPPLPGLWRADKDAEHRCDEHNAHALRLITSNYPRAQVVLAARWAVATGSARAPGESGMPVRLARSGRLPNAAEDNATLARESLHALVGGLVSRGRGVTILGPVPEQGQDVPKLKARAAMLGRIEYGDMKGRITPALYDQRNAGNAAIFREVGELHGARIVNIRDIMCQGTCRLTERGRLLYRDEDHLSAYGAQWMVLRIAPMFSQTETKRRKTI